MLTAIRLSHSGIYSQIHRTTQITTNVEECGPYLVFASFTLAFALQLRKKHGKTSVRLRKTSKYSIHITKITTRYKTHTHTHTLQNPNKHTHYKTHTNTHYKTHTNTHITKPTQTHTLQNRHKHTHYKTDTNAHITKPTLTHTHTHTYTHHY
jgi:hypothetical protein